MKQQQQQTREIDKIVQQHTRQLDKIGLLSLYKEREREREREKERDKESLVRTEKYEAATTTNK